MAENKTKPTDASVTAFIAAVENPRRRADAETLTALMGDIAGEPPVMWGPTMIGFGHLRYAYESGHSGELFRIGFAPRKPHLVIYNWSDFEGAADVIARLGKIKNGAGCLYVNKLADIDMGVLRELLEKGLAFTFDRYPPEASA